MHQNNEQIVTNLLRTTSPASLDAETVKRWAHEVAIKACEAARQDERDNSGVPRHIRNMFKPKKKSGG